MWMQNVDKLLFEHSTQTIVCQSTPPHADTPHLLWTSKMDGVKAGISELFSLNADNGNTLLHFKKSEMVKI